MMTRVVDIAQDGRSTLFAGVVYDEVAESEHSLRDGGRDRHVLNLTERNVARRARDQPLVDHDLGVGQRITDQVTLEVVISRDEQKRQSERKRDVPGNSDERQQSQQDGEENCAERGCHVTDLNKDHRRARCEDCPLDFARFLTITLQAVRGLRSGETRHLRVNGGRAAARAETRARCDI